jgi:hypothetical protein
MEHACAAVELATAVDDPDPRTLATAHYTVGTQAEFLGYLHEAIAAYDAVRVSCSHSLRAST